MTFLLIAVVVIIIVAVSVQINKINVLTSYEPVTKEVISLLETLQTILYNEKLRLVRIQSDFWNRKQRHGIISFFTDINKINVWLGFCKKNEDDMISLSMVQSRLSQTGADRFFNIIQTEDHIYFYAVAINKFDGSFRKYIPYLHNSLIEKFPNSNIRLDGSKTINFWY